MIGEILPHRNKNPRWCDQCKHPSYGRLTKARYIWRRPGEVDIFLCYQHAQEIQDG